MLLLALLVCQTHQSCCTQAAIEEKKKMLAEKAATLRRTLGRSKGETLDPLDDSSLTCSAKVCSPTIVSAHVLA